MTHNESDDVRGHVPQFMSAHTAVASIPDGAALTVEGSGGGLLEPGELLRALGERFESSGHPKKLTLVHCTGIGDRNGSGLDHLAKEGLLKRVIGGNWGMAPAMCQLALQGRIEAYNFPQGVMAQQYREIAGGRPGVITHVGLGTFCDPRIEGGKLNTATSEDLVDVVELNGREWLHYKPFPIDVAFIRATTADERGNLTMEQEGARLEALAIAQATHNRGGTVIAQVKRVALAGSLDARQVIVPGVLVDIVVVAPEQWQTAHSEYEPAFSGELTVPVAGMPPMENGPRRIIARRAAQEIAEGSVINLGVGMADGVASVIAEEGLLDSVTVTIEQGLVGGVPARGLIFGVAYNPDAIIDQPSQFDFYDGGGLDIACLGFAQIDGQGNVNVSKFGNVLVGTGGFINITQNARTVVFCGTFTSGGLNVDIDDGRLKILREGRHTKFLPDVDQITFSAERARMRGQRVLYVTERAVLGLCDDGLQLLEVAPGIDIERDIRRLLPFPLHLDSVGAMPPGPFLPGPMGLTLAPRLVRSGRGVVGLPHRSTSGEGT